MKHINQIAVTFTCAGLLISPALVAAENQYSGFLSDYGQLQPVQGYAADMGYLAHGGFEPFGRYDAIMVDQPEIFIAADSKYKGVKPDEMKALADTFRAAIVDELSSTYRIAETRGPNVLYLRVATSNIHLKKKRRLLDFTPIGVVKNAVNNTVIDNLTKKTSLIELTVEAELLDSQTGERVAALIEQRGQHKDKSAGKKEHPTSWEEVDAMMHAYAKRLVCRMVNARVPEVQRANCRTVS